MPEKRVMTPEMLQNLAIARVKALEVRRARKLESDEDKIRILENKMNKLKNVKPVVSEPDTAADAVPDTPVAEITPDDLPPDAPEPTVEETPPPKTKKKKKTVVIEQSSSESDSENVIFIKRPSRYRRETPAEAPVPVPVPVFQPPPERVMPHLNPFHTFSM